jgi:hypothetical protein
MRLQVLFCGFPDTKLESVRGTARRLLKIFSPNLMLDPII